MPSGTELRETECTVCLGLGSYEERDKDPEAYNKHHMIAVHSTRDIDELIALLPQGEPID